jgi:hypothetical protein
MYVPPALRMVTCPSTKPRSAWKTSFTSASGPKWVRRMTSVVKLSAVTAEQSTGASVRQSARSIWKRSSCASRKSKSLS